MAGTQMSRRKFLALSATTGLSALLAACGGAATPQASTEPTAAGAAAAPPTAAPAAAAEAPTSEAPPEVSTEANVIDWWHGWGGQGQKALEEVAKAFNAENRGFTVVRTQVPSVTEATHRHRRRRAARRGDRNISYAELYSRDGFQPLDDLIDSSKTFKRTDILDTSGTTANGAARPSACPRSRASCATR